jgi:hypothetical protein
MRRLPPFEDKIRQQIRDEFAIKPAITMTALKERIENVCGRGFNYEYIRKLVGKVRNEIVVEIDRTQIEQRLAFTRENYRMMRQKLLKIVYWKEGDTGPKPLARDKVKAAAGMSKKPVELLTKEFRYDPLPDDVRAMIIASWTRGGLLPRAAIERMVPSAQDVSVIANAQT